ncbi:antibiotic biosynthesis monooxygenase [Microbispora sp. NBC_01189]|uniref:antibiotic biosynthesis monooxygenase family protein n=1 Tax=Microbispora sp. NBC_01189 TaxID=2903583 RepID=UPI002E0DFC50|nr:antibiotic biosynthesis monooxygenase [Microbispora sp. NBC_01189]
MLAVIRYSVPGARTEEFATQARAILDLLAAQPGYLRGRLGRAVDEPALWALVSEWEGAGHYRRALSAARMEMYPLMTLMINEPGAFEDVYAPPGAGVNAGTTGKGIASRGTTGKA